MSEKFKAGDRVKITAEDSAWYGRYFTIEEVGVRSFLAEQIVFDEDSAELAEQVEAPVSKFKVGDRVKIPSIERYYTVEEIGEGTIRSGGLIFREDAAELAGDRWYLFYDYNAGDYGSGSELDSTHPTKDAAIRAAVKNIERVWMGISASTAYWIEDMEMSRDDGENIVWCWNRQSNTIDPTGVSAHA